jgi:hypothetical protein
MPELVNSHINILELETVLVSAEKWGKYWAGSHILVRSDNTSTVAALNKGTSRSVDMLLIIQMIFWLSLEYGFKLSAAYLPGKLNILSDRLSRQNEINAAIEAKNLLTNEFELESYGHMTQETFLWLQECWDMGLDL